MLKGLKIGLGFGLASAVITTLGLMLGLAASTGSKLVVIAGILTIAIADSFSDALGVHIAKESEGNLSPREVWQATFFTFLFKALFALSFLIPVILLPINLALYASLVWGAIILVLQSYKLARDNGTKAREVIFEHFTIAVLVMVLTYFAGRFISGLNLV